MSTASSKRQPYVPPTTVAQPAPNAAQPAAAAAAASNSSSMQQATRPAGNQPSQQQPAASNGAQPAAAAASSVAASSQPRQPSQAAAAPAAAAASSSSSSYSALPADRPQLALSDRAHYKTFILSHGVFEVESKYIMKEMIGQGAYGVVCSAFDLKAQKLVAVKKIENVFDHRSLAKRTLRELKIVRALVHENILGIERVVRPHAANFNNIYFVSELMETDLACVIRSPQELTEEHCQFFIYQVLRGLKYIHTANVIHRDLKPRNLLVNSNCDLKICDFGLARVDDPKNRDRAAMSNYIATRWYRAPEVILGRKKYTKAVDMWSIGCILAELIGRKPIFPGRDSFHQMTLICGVLGTPLPAELKATSQATQQAAAAKLAGSNGAASASAAPAVSDEYISALPRKAKIPFRQLYPHASALACDLIDKLLVFEPEKRLTVEQALAHPYLDELHCEDDEPSCTTFDASEYYWEYLRGVTKDDLRWLIHEEIVTHYPEEQFDANSPAAIAAAQKAGLAPKTKETPLNSFGAALGAALPKGKKTRRKSI